MRWFAEDCCRGYDAEPYIVSRCHLINAKVLAPSSSDEDEHSSELNDPMRHCSLHSVTYPEVCAVIGFVAGGATCVPGISRLDSG